MGRFAKFFASAAQVLSRLGNQGVLVSILVLALIGFIIVPLPTMLLDLLLVFNIVLALVVLLRGLSVDEPVRLFSFPTILLFATLFRLALNVSSTRLILLRGAEDGLGAAGEVIGSFGSFVVRGDFVVGAILFALIAVVNLVVIAKGSARVAEVAARFVLDAMPGKQLAIDAEVRAGLITQEQAAVRRELLTRESQFYGAMDGAMRFVQGDAIAALVIVFINAVGGVAIGTNQGMGIGEAVQVFGVLSIGDGLVNIIPSLLMSLAAGVIVTHVSDTAKRGSAGEMYAQLLADPSSLLLAAGALFLAALMPGLPFVPFFIVGAILAVLALSLAKTAGGTGILHLGDLTQSARTAGALERPTNAALPWNASGQAAESARIADKNGARDGINLLCLEIDKSYLASYLSKLEGGLEGFVQLFRETAENMFRERGVPLPDVTVLEREGLTPGEYRVLVREQPVRNGAVEPGRVYLGMNAHAAATLGIAAISNAAHPLDRRAGVWVSEQSPGLRAVTKLGSELVRVEQFLVLETVAGAFEVVDEILGLDEVKGLLRGVRERHPQLIEEVFERGVVSYAEITEVLRRLVRERVNVRDLKLILEGVSELASSRPPGDDRQDWLNELHGFLRLVLARSIVRDARGPGETLRVFMLSGEAEEEFRSAMTVWEGRRSKPPIEPELETRLRENARKMFQPVLERGSLPVVLLCSGDVRPAVQEFFVRQLAGGEWIRTLSYQELDGNTSPESVGVLGI